MAKEKILDGITRAYIQCKLPSIAGNGSRYKIIKSI